MLLFHSIRPPAACWSAACADDALLTMLIPTDRGPTEKALNYLHHAISVLTHYYPVCVCKHGVPIR